MYLQMNWLARVCVGGTVWGCVRAGGSVWYAQATVVGVTQRLTSWHLISLGVSLYGTDVSSAGPTVSVGEGRGATFDAVSSRWPAPVAAPAHYQCSALYTN